MVLLASKALRHHSKGNVYNYIYGIPYFVRLFAFLSDKSIVCSLFCLTNTGICPTNLVGLFGICLTKQHILSDKIILSDKSGFVRQNYNICPTNYGFVRQISNKSTNLSDKLVSICRTNGNPFVICCNKILFEQITK